jgi:hypothetical protein
VERAPHPALSPRRAGRGRRESAAPHSRGTMRPSFAKQCRPMKSEGAGNAGCPMHPQPRVRFVVGVCTRVFTAEAPETSGIPHAMVLTAYIALSPGTGRSCPRRSRDKPATLTPASGRQDHTTSPSAPAPLVLRRRCVHRIPHPTSVTIAIRPSWWDGMAGRIHNFWFSEREIFFRKRLDRGIKKQPVGQIKLKKRAVRTHGSLCQARQ